MKRRISYTLPLVLALFVIFGMFVGFKYQETYKRKDNVKGKSTLLEVLNYIENDYVDEPNEKELTDAAINGMLKELDPHSVYIPPSDVERSTEDLRGNFEGIGIEFNILNDTIIVVSPISGGPSEAVGIRAGDRIVKVDGEVVAGNGITNEDVVKKLRGDKGTKVKVGIKRGGESKLLDFTITRDKIPIYSVDAAYMVTPDIGYIKINRFGGTTLTEYNNAFGKLRRKGMKNLVLDLRGNPGGYLMAAIQLADEYLRKGQMVVYTNGRKRPKDEYTASPMGAFEEGKLAVLIDEGSASASEIVSGALQDWDRALIVGRRSFGKGLVQEPIMLENGGQLRLTVARYYTPSGRSIQRTYAKGADDYYDDLSRRVEHGEFYSKDSIKVIDSLKTYTLVNKRPVYGGGGILPDIFVPVDTTENSEYLRAMLNKGVFSEFVLNYVDRSRSNIRQKYPDPDTYYQGFSIDKNILNSFVSEGEKMGIKKDSKGLSNSQKYIERTLKALIGRQIYGDNTLYFQIMNEENDALNKAIEAINSDAFDKMKIRYK